MRRDTVTGMEHLDRRVGDPGLDQLPDQPRGDRVEMPVQLNVVIGCHPAALPLGIGVGISRQRQQHRPVDAVEELPPAGAKLAHQPSIQIALNLVDRLVKLPQRQKPTVSQLGQNEPLDDQHRGLDFCLVARVSDTARQDRRAVMGRHFLIGAVDPGLVAAGGGDARAQIVADQELGHATQERQRVDMRPDPIGQPLAPAGFGIRVVRGPQHRDEYVRRPFLAGFPVEHRHRVARVVDE